MVLFLVYFYYPILFSPNSYLFGDTGDAAKNYFCYQWHVQNDRSLINYTGTNYPFGEQHIFTDGNPLLSNIVKLLPFLKGYSIGIFNLCLLLSIVITALLLFAILRKFNVTNGFAILGAIGIAILNPQTNRLGSHFNLAYSFFIPLVIYLLLLFETHDKKIKYNIYIFFVLACSFFVHPYMGMILTSMLFLYHVIKLVFFRSAFKLSLFAFLIQSFLPIAFYFVFIRITDGHENRTSHPYGFLFFTARIETIFVSSLPPLRHMISQIIKVYEQNWEGLAYVGVTTLLMVLYLPFLIYRKRKQFKTYILENKSTSTWLVLSISSFMLLLFSMGLPFKWGAEGLLDSIPFIKQFRSPGRFAWVFYYMATISSVVVLSKYFLTKANRYVRATVITALLLLYTVEGLPFHNQIKDRGFIVNCFKEGNSNEELRKICEAVNKIKPKAIIPLPFFHQGTDYFGLPGTDKIKTASFIVALETNTPILGSCTDRTSLKEAEILIPLVGSNLIKKDFIDHTKPGEKFCVIYSKEMLTEGEKQLLAKGKMITETNDFIVCEILSAELVRDDKEKYRSYYDENKNSLISLNGCLVKDSCYAKAVTFLNGNAELKGKISEEVTIGRIPPRSLINDKIYEVSFWYDLTGGDELANKLLINEVSKSRNEVVKLVEVKCSQMPDIVNGKVLVKAEFRPIDKEDEVRIELTGNSEYKGEFTLRDLLIRPKDNDVYQVRNDPDGKGKSLFVNNYKLN
ncbi:MAG: hypothetical protein ACXVNR_01285 [Bacteroidia bacterium]